MSWMYGEDSMTGRRRPEPPQPPPDEPGVPPLPNYRRRVGCSMALAFFVALLYGFGAPVHYSDPIRIKFIDEETGRPLQGVAVLAVWWLRNIHGTDTAKVLYRAEAISGPDGVAVVPGMPLRFRPPLHHFRTYDPVIHAYKPGYRPQGGTNADAYPNGWRGPHRPGAMKRVAFWDGLTLPMARTTSPRDDLESYRSAATSPAGGYWLHPKREPKYWAVLVEGYARLTPESKAVEANPADPDFYNKEGIPNR